MKKRVRLSRLVAVAGMALGVLLLAAQLVRPARVNPAPNPALSFAGQAGVDPAATAILQRACADCHSNQTHWPWYSNVAPISWLLAHDVSEGRSTLNFSEWSRYDAAQRARLLFEICEDVREGEMPPFEYTLLHRQAKLDGQDVKTLCSPVRPASKTKVHEGEQAGESSH